MSQTDWKKSLNSSKTIINLFAHDGIVSHYTGVGTIAINYIYSLKKIFPAAVINLITPSYNKNSLGYSKRIEKLNANIIASNNGKIYKLSNGSKGVRSFGDISNWNVLSKNSAKLIKLINRNNKGSRILNIFFDTPYAGIFDYLADFIEKNELINIWVPHSTAKIHKIDSALPDSDKNMKKRISWELSAINRANKTKGCYVASIGEYMTEHLHNDYGVKKNKIVPFYNGLYQGRTHLEGKRLTVDEKKALV